MKVKLVGGRKRRKKRKREQDEEDNQPDPKWGEGEARGVGGGVERISRFAENVACGDGIVGGEGGRGKRMMKGKRPQGRERVVTLIEIVCLKVCALAKEVCAHGQQGGQHGRGQ